VTDYTDHVDRLITDRLRRCERRGEGAQTAWEISEATGVPMSTVRAALKRLTAAREIRQLGTGPNGARTWVLIPRTEETP
jgi:DNA-binding IclR family transcriptional regulator